MPCVTHFWFYGDRDQGIERLAATVRAMADLPVDRVERERGILRAEAQGRGSSQWSVHAAYRYGTTGFGLVAFDEFGLARLGRADLRAYAKRFYASGNVVLYMTGVPPAELDIRLPEGPVVQAPQPRPIPYVEYPSSLERGPDGSVGVSFVVQRTHAQVAAKEIAEARLRQWLRHRAGVTYQARGALRPLDERPGVCAPLGRLPTPARRARPQHADRRRRRSRVGRADGGGAGARRRDGPAVLARSRVDRRANSSTTALELLFRLARCRPREERLGRARELTPADVAARPQRPGWRRRSSSRRRGRLRLAAGSTRIRFRARPLPSGDKTYRQAKRERGGEERAPRRRRLRRLARGR